MLARVADSIYWLSRYIERAENVARFIDVNYNLTLGETDQFGDRWTPLVYTTGDHADFSARYGEPNRDNVLKFLLFDRENPNSIISCVDRARENARTIREAISAVSWEQINKFYFMVHAEAEKWDQTLEQPHEFCERVRMESHLFVGAVDSTISHGEAWHFARIGRLLERADKTSRIVDVQYFLLLPNVQDVGTALDVVRWSALLKSASALAMYRRQHGKIVPERVADFLILDREFPRSMHFCIIESLESMRRITGSAPGTYRNQSEQLLGQRCARMNYSNITQIIQQGLHEYIDEFQSQLNRIGEAIAEDFFRSGLPTTTDDKKNRLESTPNFSTLRQSQSQT